MKDPIRRDALTCGVRIQRGARPGRICGRAATAIVVHEGTLVCGIHARAWVEPGLARIARWHEKERAWL